MTFRLTTEDGGLIPFISAADLFEHVLASFDDDEIHQISRQRAMRPRSLPVVGWGAGTPLGAPADLFETGR